MKLSVSMEKACRDVIKRLPPNGRRLEFTFPRLDPADAGSFAHQYFDAINDLLFLGVLKGKVHLRLLDMHRVGPRHHGSTAPAGVDHRRICININRHIISMGNWKEDMLATLIHQMAHAYFLVRCGYHDPTRPGKNPHGHDLSHNAIFCALLQKIQSVLRVYVIYPDLLRCKPSLGHHFLDIPDVPEHIGRPGRSDCEWGPLAPFPPKAEIDSCYAKLTDQPRFWPLGLWARRKRTAYRDAELREKLPSGMWVKLR
ncbi:hypothetical protein KEM54_000508, partial [Ascosphaera aggregata]